MSILVCGSVAYDHIMHFDGHFADQASAANLDARKLDLSVFANKMDSYPGGTGANIAYNLAMLGQKPHLIASVGEQGPGADIALKLCQMGVNIQGVSKVEGLNTAACFVVHDRTGSQVNIFYPGAMFNPKPPKIHDVVFNSGNKFLTPRIAILAPDGGVAMLEHANECKHFSIPYMFDPGQGLSMYSVSQLHALVAHAEWVIGNEQEIATICEKLGVASPCELTRINATGSNPKLVRTLGERGAEVFYAARGSRQELGQTIADRPNWSEANACYHISVPAAKLVSTVQVVDPTGCGDAFRAGFLHGLVTDRSIETCLRLGTIMGSIKIQQRGGQNHFTDHGQIDFLLKHAVENQ